MSLSDLAGAIDAALANPAVQTTMQLLLILVAAMAGIWLTQRFANRIDSYVRTGGDLGPTEGEKRLRTLANIVRYTITILIVAVALMMILRQTGIDVGPLLAGAGIAGVVLGFGAQNIVRDYLAGIFILMENQYAVADVIEVAGVAGRVEKVTLRMTQLRDLSGSVHVVPNGEIKVVTNFTKEWSKALLDVGVAYKEDVDRVMEILQEVGVEMADDETWGPRLLEPVNVMGVQDFSDSAVVIRMNLKTVPDMRWDVARELRRRIKNRFDQEDIEIPFPHRTLYVGTGASGTLEVATSGRGERPRRTRARSPAEKRVEASATVRSGQASAEASTDDAAATGDGGVRGADERDSAPTRSRRREREGGGGVSGEDYDG